MPPVHERRPPHPTPTGATSRTSITQLVGGAPAAGQRPGAGRRRHRGGLLTALPHPPIPDHVDERLAGKRGVVGLEPVDVATAHDPEMVGSHSEDAGVVARSGGAAPPGGALGCGSRRLRLDRRRLGQRLAFEAGLERRHEIGGRRTRGDFHPRHLLTRGLLLDRFHQPLPIFVLIPLGMELRPGQLADQPLGQGALLLPQLGVAPTSISLMACTSSAK